jgi:hypothetical protein
LRFKIGKSKIRRAIVNNFVVCANTVDKEGLNKIIKFIGYQNGGVYREALEDFVL